MRFEHGPDFASKDATEEFDPRKRARVKDAEEKDVVASTPLPKKNRDDFVNVEADITLNGQ